MNAQRAPESAVSVTEELRVHLVLCEEMLTLVTEEGDALRGGDVFAGDAFSKRREALLPRLTESLDALRRVREVWQAMDPSARARQGDAEALMRRNQDLIMRIIVLDRENEQILLRRGLVPPAQLPASQRQRPHLVAARYFQNLPTDPRNPSACPSSAS